jgi:hypothetical protein
MVSDRLGPGLRGLGRNGVRTVSTIAPPVTAFRKEQAQRMPLPAAAGPTNVGHMHEAHWGTSPSLGGVRAVETPSEPTRKSGTGRWQLLRTRSLEGGTSLTIAWHDDSLPMECPVTSTLVST